MMQTRRVVRFSLQTRSRTTADRQSLVGDVKGVIRSWGGGSDEVRRGLCYDEHHGWMVTVVVMLPETRPCVVRDGVGVVDKGRSSPAW
jgi:hypothetical protein